jgi:hypothetical protein
MDGEMLTESVNRHDPLLGVDTFPSSERYILVTPTNIFKLLETSFGEASQFGVHTRLWVISIYIFFSL